LGFTSHRRHSAKLRQVCLFCLSIYQSIRAGHCSMVRTRRGAGIGEYGNFCLRYPRTFLL
jgi:hypothetical protein